MATWQDGPEYAPLERPDEFAVPDVVPLEAAAPPPRMAAAPVERPAFDGPAVPVAPLAALVPPPADERDPQRPFDVASSNLTTPGAWAGVHGSAPHEPALLPPASAPWPVQGWTSSGGAGPASSAPGYPPAPGHPGAAGAGPPDADPYASGGYRTAAPTADGFPGPGTPQWFGPGPYGEQPPEPERVDARQVLYAVTPGLLICLGVGVLISPLAPILLVLAFVLGRRVKAAQMQVRRTLALALGSLGAFALIGLLSNPFGFSDWWGVLAYWSRVVCFVTFVVVVVQVWARLRSRQAQPRPPQPVDPGDPGPWR